MSPAPATADVRLGRLERGDCGRLLGLFGRLSRQSLYRRFLHPVVRPEQAHAERLLDVDHRDREAVTAELGGELLGVARYARLPGGDRAEIAVVVADAWQRRGLGRRLLGRLTERARESGIAGFTAVLHADNRPAVELVRSVFPEAGFRFEDGLLAAEIPLPPSCLAGELGRPA